MKYEVKIGRKKKSFEFLDEALAFGVQSIKEKPSLGPVCSIWDNDSDTTIAVITDDADGITCHRLRPNMNIDAVEAGAWDKIAKTVSVSR